MDHADAVIGKGIAHLWKFSFRHVAGGAVSFSNRTQLKRRHHLLVLCNRRVAGLTFRIVEIGILANLLMRIVAGHATDPLIVGVEAFAAH